MARAREIPIRWDMFRIILARVWVKGWWSTVRAIVFIWCNGKGDDGVQRCLPMRLIWHISMVIHTWWVYHGALISSPGSLPYHNVKESYIYQNRTECIPALHQVYSACAAASFEHIKVQAASSSVRAAAGSSTMGDAMHQLTLLCGPLEGTSSRVVGRRLGDRYCLQ